MTHLGITAYKSDPGIYLYDPRKEDNGLTYWKCIFIYVDDALYISQRAEHDSQKNIDK